ncbi:hypothetical protein SHIRM173S_04237 [Streptomyces hirsutus]
MIASMVMPWFHRARMTAPDRPAVEATERSISPETTSSVMGRAISAIGRVLPIRKDRLSALPKPSTVVKDSSRTTTSRAPTTVSHRTEGDPADGARESGVSHGGRSSSSGRRPRAGRRSGRPRWRGSAGAPLMASTHTELTPRAGRTLLTEVSSRAP